MWHFGYWENTHFANYFENWTSQTDGLLNATWSVISAPFHTFPILSDDTGDWRKCTRMLDPNISYLAAGCCRLVVRRMALLFGWWLVSWASSRTSNCAPSWWRRHAMTHLIKWLLSSYHLFILLFILLHSTSFYFFEDVTPFVVLKPRISIQPLHTCQALSKARWLHGANQLVAMPGQEPAFRCNCDLAESCSYILNSEVSLSIQVGFSASTCISVFLLSVFPPMFKRYASNSGPRVRTPLRDRVEHELPKEPKGAHSASKSQEDAEKVRKKNVANVLPVVQGIVLHSKVSRRRTNKSCTSLEVSRWDISMEWHANGATPIWEIWRLLHNWEIRWVTAVAIKIRLTKYRLLRLFKSSSFE